MNSQLEPWVRSGQLALVDPESASDFEWAFVSRDVAGLSTKHELQPQTRHFYDLMLGAPCLSWVQAHSAGLDRQVFVDLMKRGVEVHPARGANAPVVAQTALCGLLALARHLPLLISQQREHRWLSLMATGVPRDLIGQLVVLVGWGPVAQCLAPVLRALGMRIEVIRRTADPALPGVATHSFESLYDILPRADWLILACPLTEQTRGLFNARLLGRLPLRAHLINVARGEIVDERALIEALTEGALAGAFLDVFAHEPLPTSSPLWELPNVIATPHSAGFSDGNAKRVEDIFLLELMNRLQA